MKKGKEDRISSLTTELRSKILTFLPIKDAVRTCVLSTVWKYEWASMPDICINCLMFTSGSALVQSVDVLLSRRTAPIRKFSISMWVDVSAPWIVSQALDRWMVILSSNKIEEASIRLGYYDPPNPNLLPVSSGVFSCVFVKKLELDGCTIQVPPNFKGFKLLTSLILKFYSASDADLERLIFSCPMLESAILDSDFCKVWDLNLCAPNLQHLNISGNFRMLSLQTPHLIDLTFDAYHCSNALAMQHRERNFNRLFGQCFHCITSVSPSKAALVIIGAKCLQNNSLGSFANLKNLSLQLCSWCPIETAAALVLFQKAQNLERLGISKTMMK